MSVFVTVRREMAARHDLAKLPAFFRRDLLIACSYRAAFVSDAAALVLQALIFSVIGKLIDPGRLPVFDGHKASYMEFVVVGIALAAFVQLGLGRVATAIRQEQMMGTLESLLMTPTKPTTIQLGSVVYDLLYVPVRIAVFIAVIGFAFGLNFEASGVAPALLMLVLFIPFVWGLGILSAAGILTFRRGAQAVGFVALLLTIGSGAYFPVDALPGWIQEIARLNPITIAANGMRDALIGGAGWGHYGSTFAELIPASIISLCVGLGAFQLALRRERARGTLGIY